MAGEASDFEDWGPDSFPNLDGTTANNGNQVQTQSVFDQSTVSTGNDAWGGIWNTIGKAVNTGVNYFVAKDAAKSGLVAGYAPNGQPVYQQQYQPLTQQAPLASTGSLLLIVGGIALIAVLAEKAK